MPLGFDVDAYNQINPQVVRPWYESTVNVNRAGFGYNQFPVVNDLSNQQNQPQAPMAGVAASMAGGAAQGASSGLFGIFGDLIKGKTQQNLQEHNLDWSRESLKKTQDFAAEQANLGRQYGTDQNKLWRELQLALLEKQLKMPFDYRSEGINQQSDALQSMGLPRGAWALNGLGASLPRTTQMINRGSYMTSRLPGDPTLVARNNSAMQQYMGVGNYLTR